MKELAKRKHFALLGGAVDQAVGDKGNCRIFEADYEAKDVMSGRRRCVQIKVTAAGEDEGLSKVFDRGADGGGPESRLEQRVRAGGPDGESLFAEQGVEEDVGFVEDKIPY